MGVEFIDTSPEPTIVTIKTEQAALKVLLTQYANTYTRYINEKKNQATDNINSSNSSIKSTLDTQKAAILTKLNGILTLIKQVYPKGNKIKSEIDRNASYLFTTITELKNTVENDYFNKLMSEIEKLEGNYEESQITVKSNFYNYLLYVVLVIIIFGSLIYIYSSSESGRLEMVILGLGICIFIYYCYDYLFKKKFNM